MHDGFGLILMFVVIGWLALFVTYTTTQRRRRRQAFWDIVHTHGDALARRYLQLVRTNEYGKVEMGPWEKEKTKFIKTVLVPDLRAKNIRPEIASALAARFSVELTAFAMGRAKDMTAGLTFDARMSPLEFEQLCAEILRRNGWDAQLTKGSGDQGVDIFATRNGVSLVVQCKLYNRPVGNKAVQEAHAAKVHMRADLAAVVTNAEFTPSARQLAATTTTHLLHYTELGDLAASQAA